MPPEGAFGDVTRAGDAVRAVVRQGHAVALCEGHFPGEPIVPGALLAGLMADLAAELMPQRTLAEVERCVFVHAVTPGHEIGVSARRLAGGRVRAEVLVEGRTAARAVFRFAAAR